MRSLLDWETELEVVFHLHLLHGSFRKFSRGCRVKCHSVTDAYGRSWETFPPELHWGDHPPGRGIQAIGFQTVVMSWPAPLCARDRERSRRRSSGIGRPFMLAASLSFLALGPKDFNILPLTLLSQDSKLTYKGKFLLAAQRIVEGYLYGVYYILQSQ